jgi:hypothetical protein
VVDGGTSFCLSVAALDEVLGVEERAELLVELGERRRLGLVDRQVRGLQRGLDAERPARGDLAGQPDAGI